MTENQPTALTIVPDEVADSFAALLETTNFTQDLQIFKVGIFDRSLRKRLLRELEATYIGLWALTLERSFPDQTQIIFQCFLDKYIQKIPAKQQSTTSTTIQAYRDMLISNGDQNFSQVSRHLLSFVSVDDSDLKAEILRLSLVLRNHYNTIFRRLV